MEPAGARAGSPPARGAGANMSLRGSAAREPPVVRGTGWLFSPLWSPRTKRRGENFGGEMSSDQAWLDDHSDFTRAYFSRRSSA